MDPELPGFEELRSVPSNATSRAARSIASCLMAWPNCWKTSSASKLIWGVVTNKPLRFAEPIMEQLGLAQRSALLICPDHVKNSKPDPEPLILACKMLDLDPASVLFVGMTLRDIESGRDAGTRTAAVTYGYIHPDDNARNWGADVVVDHPLELRKVLDSALCSC